MLQIQQQDWVRQMDGTGGGTRLPLPPAATGPSLSVVLPCHRAVTTLPTLVDRLGQVLTPITSEHEVILVVDGPEDSWAVATGLATKYDHVTAIRLAREFGQHNAVIAGLRAAQHELIVTMDDDQRYPPEEIPRLLAALSDDVDLVYAVPAGGEHAAAQGLSARATRTAMSGVMDARNAQLLGPFRLFRSFLRTAFDQVDGPDVSVDVTLSWATTRVAGVPVPVDSAAGERSEQTRRALLGQTVNLVMGYSTAPLRLVTYLGFLIGACGLLLAIKLLWDYFGGNTTVAGFTTIATLIAVFSSAQLIGIGVLGEYLSRVHIGGMGRPTYVVRERVDGPDGDPATYRNRP